MPSTTPHRTVSVRTAPKLLPFLIGAVAVAFTAAVVVVYSTPPAENYTRASSLGHMTLVFCMPALALAATAWLTVEKLLRRKKETYSIAPAERTADGPR
ncbi:hypothetical protein [Nesterenkonia sp.]|uniref:hypothetical protein n=1 Tax=Nesterenkonia sp. TaxID=704201 RepID=UPI00260B8554|nr:hypothetical protein [Nesterenkonia sp.]